MMGTMFGWPPGMPARGNDGTRRVVCSSDSLPAACHVKSWLSGLVIRLEVIIAGRHYQYSL
eukprot:1142609-Pelagomonas_calceolata.AAC.11